MQESLLTRAGGNPLYAEQFARLLAEVGHHKELPLPENVQGIIAARLDGLPAAEKQLLQDAAVLGKVFWLGAVAAVGDLGRHEAEERLHALERKEFVRRERRSSVGGEDEYAFRHLLVRDVAYGQIPRGSRAERHERAAGWIAGLGRPEDHAEMLARHYLEALRLRAAARQEAPADLVERARLAARDAGDRALALGAYSGAARFYEAALELWPREDEIRPDLLLAYARSRVDEATLEDAVLEEATEGLLQAGRIENAAEALARLGGVWMSRGDRDRGLEHLERARGLVDDRGPSPAKAFVLQELARFLMMANELDRSIELGTESLLLAEELGLDSARARNLNTLGVTRVVMGDLSGLRDLEEAVAIAAAAHSHEEVSALANLTWMTVLLGDLRRAGELQERCSAAAARLGVAGFIRWQQAEHVFHCHWQGRWDEALATANDFTREVQTGSHYMESACRWIRGWIFLGRGDTEPALGEAIRASEVSRPVKDPQVLNPALTFEARARLAAGDRAGAIAVADELVAIWRELEPQEPHELVNAAWVFRDLGRSGELAEAVARKRAQTPWHDAARMIVEGDLAGAADVYAEIGSVPDEAYARLRAAEELVRAGHRAEADRQLRLAQPLFAQLGATAWAAEAEALLAASA